MISYDVEKVKKALQFFTVEVLPSDPQQFHDEVERLVHDANESQSEIRHYIGFEISGRIHLGTGAMTAIKIKALQDAGIKTSLFFANYHTWLNEKLDGTMETIKLVKDSYFKPMFLKCCEAFGCDVHLIDCVDAEILYDARKTTVNNVSFWDYFMMASKNLTLNRVLKSISITGKKEGDAVQFGTLCYPAMQVADAFFMNTHIVHAGMDQRKCHVLMREIAMNMGDTYGISLHSRIRKPLALHHELLLSLGVDAQSVAKKMNFSTQTGDVDDNADLKMSKSKPDSAIWVHDNEEEIRRKMKQAYCPLPDPALSDEENQKIQSFNPILNWIRLLVFSQKNSFHINRPEKFGGILVLQSYDELYTQYMSGAIHPLDLKQSLADELVAMLTPIIDFGNSHQDSIDLVTSFSK